MDRRIITAFLALLSTLISAYSFAYKSIVLQSTYFLCKRERLAYLTLFSTLRRRLIRQRWLNQSRLSTLLLSPAHFLAQTAWQDLEVTTTFVILSGRGKSFPYAVVYLQLRPGVWRCGLYYRHTCFDPQSRSSDISRSYDQALC